MFVYRRGVIVGAALIVLVLIVVSAAPTTAGPAAASTGTYSNPLNVQTAAGEVVESCADPAIIRGQAPEDNRWYMYCTTDPLNGDDRDANGDLNFHLIPTFTSVDLINWTYVGDAFDSVPAWGEPSAGLWAPDIHYANGQYYLYYVMTDVTPDVSGEPADCHADNAIGVATSTSPTGPWEDHGAPVVGPRRAGPGCNFFWTFDPDVITVDSGQQYIYYGSYYGGIQVRELSTDGFTAPADTAVQVTIPNRYEGAHVVEHEGYYYLFVSATDCCRGPLTGYSVFVGRSSDPRGPFVDKEGVSLLDGRVGGTPAISMNGNRWVGPGHNFVFTDFDGQDWFLYHAIDRHDPYFEDAVGFTKRPALLDGLDWIDGWPTVRAGRWASDTPQHAPAAQPGDKTEYNVKTPRDDVPGELIEESSDEFDADTLSSQWQWVREPAAGTYGLTDGTFRFDTQAADLFVDSNNASVLTEPAPDGNYVVETRMKLNLPPEGCCFNFTQAGLVIYGGDDNYLKLTHVSIWETRQTEFAKEVYPVPDGYPRYGNTVVGPPDEWTYLRIVRRMHAGEEHYTAYTSRDGQTWVRGGTWTHNLGNDARIGLVSMAGAGFTANFDYVRVYKLHR